MLSAYAINCIINYYSRLNKNYINFLILIFFVTKVIVFNYIIYTDDKFFFKKQKNFISYKIKRKILNDINNIYNISSSELLKKLIFAQYIGNELKFEHNPMQYQIENFKFTNSENKKNLKQSCILILIGNSNNIKNEKLKLNGHEEIRITNIFNNKEYSVVNYTMNNNVCLSGVLNPYIFTKDEINLAKKFKKLQEIEIINEKFSLSEAFLFHINKTSSMPIDIGVKFNFNENNEIQSAVLISKRLRNYTTLLNGFWSKTYIENPSLTFKNKNTKKKIYFLMGKVGYELSTPIKIELEKYKMNYYDYNIYFNYKSLNKEYSILLK